MTGGVSTGKNLHDGSADSERKGDAMRIVGVRRSGGGVDVAQLSDDATVTVLTGVDEFWMAPYGWMAHPARGATIPVDAATLVPPLRPDAQFFCVGLNYRDHAAEGTYADEPLPEVPTVSGRWGRSVCVDGSEIPVPAGEDGLDWEGEIVAWVGRELVNATPEEALAAIVGYSVFNDVTARRAQKATSQWLLGKNADRSGALGPLVPATEVGDIGEGLRLRTTVNGETMQDASTDSMIHTPEMILAYISQTITLLPGDLVATGTPSGVGYARKPPRLLVPGDQVQVEVERLGKVCNTIVASAAQRPTRSAAAAAAPSSR